MKIVFQITTDIFQHVDIGQRIINIMIVFVKIISYKSNAKQNLTDIRFLIKK